MKSAIKITAVLMLALAICFVVASPPQAGHGWTPARMPRWAKNLLENSKMAVSIPIWKITQECTAKSVKWVDSDNPRFAIYDPKGDSDPADEPTLLDDLVLDKETGLVWTRDAGALDPTKWKRAVDARDLIFGNRAGWRLPTVPELASLMDPSQTNPPLPTGHPFIRMEAQYYWTSTTSQEFSDRAWAVSMSTGAIDTNLKTAKLPVWLVRGGSSSE